MPAQITSPLTFRTTNADHKDYKNYPVHQKQDTLLFPITLSTVDGFSKFFHKWTQQQTCNKVISNDIQHIATLPSET